MPVKRQEEASYKLAQTQNFERHISRAVSEFGPKTAPLPPSTYYLNIDSGTRQSVPTYVLKDLSGTVEKAGVNTDLCSPYSMNSLLTRIKSSNFSTTNCDSSLPSDQRKKSPTGARTSQPQFASRSGKVNADSSITNAVQNRSMLCNVSRPSAMKTDAEQATRRAVRPSHTSSATVTRNSTPTTRTTVTRPSSTHTNQQLHRKIHSGNVSTAAESPPLKRTYSVKKPLPYKASSATLKCQSTCRRPSAARSQWQCADDDDDDTQKSDNVTADITIAESVNVTTRKPKLSSSPRRTPTPKPSLKQVRVVRRGDSLHAGQPYLSSQAPKARYCNKGKNDQMQSDGLAAETAHCNHSSRSEHSFSSKHDADYYTTEEQAFHHRAFSTAISPTCHKQIRRKPTDTSDGRRQQLMEQAIDSMSSGSQESVVSCRPHHKKRRTRLRAPTLSMCTLATDVARFVTRPVTVAPSGAAGNRRVSKIPRPKSSVRPSVSVTSTISKCSSITNVHVELNYARPMPIERIPFSKFGLECIVPLARQEVSVTAVEAFSITGLSGERKRFLPQIERTADGMWERLRTTVDALPVVTAQYDACADMCTVSIVSSIVARPVAHTATQTHKSVALTPSTRQRKKSGTRLLRKEKLGKQNANNEDYSGMLVRLVQLLYLQTKLNATRADKNNSAATEAPDRSQTLRDCLLARQRLHTARRATPQINTHPQPSDHGARVYRMGSSVTQVYSKNYPSTPAAGPAEVESANKWANAIKSRTVYFDRDQSETKPWSNYRSPTPTAFKPSYNRRLQNYDNRHSKIFSYPSFPNMRYTYRPAAGH